MTACQSLKQQEGLLERASCCLPPALGPGPGRTQVVTLTRAVRTEQVAAASRGELHMVVHELLPLEQAVLAHQKMDAGEVFGRIVLAP